jgi:cytochrome c biogenesis protein CcmG, thiol:disulfide interchange protein DsbE
MSTARSSSRHALKQQREAQQRKTRRQNIMLIVGSVMVIGAVLALAFSATPKVSVSPAQIGKPISKFTLTDLNGVTHSIADYKGRPVLINSWATWCPPCKAEMPALHEFYLKHKDDGFELLAINSGEGRSAVQQFIGQTGFTFPVLLDTNKDVLDGLGVSGLPTSIFVGRDGTVKTIHIGGLTPDAIEKQLTPLLSQ